MDPLDDDRVDLLESTASSRSHRAVVVVVIAVAAAAVGLLSHAAHSPQAAQRSAPLPSPTVSTGPATGHPNAPAPASNRRHLSVYFESLDHCTSTDHLRRLRVAVAVTNLNDQPVRLVSATAVGSGPGLLLQRVQLGARPCAERASRAPTRLPSSGEVVALNFVVGPGCPRDNGIDVRMTFAAGGSTLQAGTVVSLNHVKFLECPSV